MYSESNEVPPPFIVVAYGFRAARVILEASPPKKQTRCTVFHAQVREVVLSLRGEQEGKHDDFLDHMAEGMNSMVATARRGTLCWGFMVFMKPVSLRESGLRGSSCADNAVVSRGG